MTLKYIKNDLGGEEANKRPHLLIICLGSLHTKHHVNVTHQKDVRREYATYENIC